jgi:hypothetical protein
MPELVRSKARDAAEPQGHEVQQGSLNFMDVVLSRTIKKGRPQPRLSTARHLPPCANEENGVRAGLAGIVFSQTR